MTILDACVTALQKERRSLSADEIYEVIVRENLYRFGAKDPRSMVRGTLRKHLKSAGAHRLIESSKGSYRLP